jgi:WD40 repeat protein
MRRAWAGRHVERNAGCVDTDYENDIYGLSFGANHRLATASEDGKIRLYDRNFKLIVPPRQTTGGKGPFRIAFSPDGRCWNPMTGFVG